MTPRSSIDTAAPSLPHPLADVIVLRARPLRHGTGPAPLSRFGDMAWSLAEAQPDRHTQPIMLYWPTFPAALVEDFKAFTLAVLDHPYPPVLSRITALDQASAATAHMWFKRLRVFATWLTDHGIKGLSAVTGRDLDLYLDHVRSLQCSTNTRRQLLSAVRAVWAYAPHLPPQRRMAVDAPWRGQSPGELAEETKIGRGNKTPRIAADTMTALLDWALRIVEDIGPDIRDAWREFRLLSTGTHPGQRPFAGLSPTERVQSYLQILRKQGGSLPGDPERPGAIGFPYLACLLGMPARSGSLSSSARSLAEAAGLPVTTDLPLGRITGRIDGRPWREAPLTASELPALVWAVTAASHVVVSYLSGMRPGEVSNLRRGCRAEDPESGELLLLGHRGKGYNRSPAETQAPASRPWAVVHPVHEAIALLESLHETDLLFPTRLAGDTRRRRSRAGARTWDTAKTNRELKRLQTWVNSTFIPASGTTAIPPDPVKHLHASRFRRTLAYFIVRRPRGLIAAALQYGHLKTKVTLNYAAQGDDSWLDDVAVERLEMLLEQSEDDWTRLAEDHEHVSGPAATEYRRRTAGAASFLGRTIRAQAAATPRTGGHRHPPRRSHDLRLPRGDRDVPQGEAPARPARRRRTRRIPVPKHLLKPRLHRPGHRRTPSTPTPPGGRRTRCDDSTAAPGPRCRPSGPDPRSDRTARGNAARRSRHEMRPDMTRRVRDRNAEREEVRAAATRLLAGTPLRSTTGKLTGTELIIECGLRRDIVYRDHKDLVDEFRARARAQNLTPQIVQRMAEDNAALRDALAKTKAELALERERVRALVRATSELSLELDQAREELAAAQQVTRLPRARGGGTAFQTHDRLS